MITYTKVIDPNDIDLKFIQDAADVIRSGGLVAFPTETVYGLGANALDPKAVSKIFEAKRRPLDDPLIVHINDAADLEKLTKDIPEKAYELARVFWPGPLTLILSKKDIVPDITTCGLDTVAIRMPSGSIARELIKISGVPIAAPSANLFGRPSSTNAHHVKNDLEGYIDMILDGGKTLIGVESTVIEMVDSKAVILRPGGIDIEEIRKVIKDVKVFSEQEVLQNSPGKYPQHYSPKAKVIISRESASQKKTTLELAGKFKAKGLNVGIMAKSGRQKEYAGYNVKEMGSENDLKEIAANLFHILREFDTDGVQLIIAEAVKEPGLGLAIMNRLRKAAG
ncbi:MAG: threonylcarbamoyl-AMP synthase [Candidatus Omnitrophica bacterium]|nr:threonylcarbamoyl-AMP synthase [Candidatus Omnitrophota bacterium]